MSERIWIDGGDDVDVLYESVFDYLGMDTVKEARGDK